MSVNLVRFIVAPAFALAFGLSGTACKQDAPNGTSKPPESGGNIARADDGDDDGAAAADDDGPGDGDDDGSASKKCEAQIAEAPTALFSERVLIRPPVNVELLEQNPMFAAAVVSGGFVSACDATVDRMSISVYESDEKRSIKTYLNEVIKDQLPAQGYQGGSRGDNTVTTETEVHTTMEYPADKGQPPAKLYIAVSRKFDNVFVVTYQTRPEEFDALAPSFKASAESLLVVPPDA